MNTEFCSFKSGEIRGVVTVTKIYGSLYLMINESFSLSQTSVVEYSFNWFIHLFNMSWLTNFLKCESECSWVCCVSSAKNKINHEYFWKEMDRMKEETYLFRSPNRFIFEKVIHLNMDEKHATTLTIGLDPENRFKIAGRLDVKITSKKLILNLKQLNNLLIFLSDYETSFSTTLPIEDTYSKYGLKIHRTQARMLELFMNKYSVNIDEDSLKTMWRMRLHIQHLISSFEGMSEKYELQFFSLLGHFCANKTIQEANDLVETSFKQYFLEEIVSFHCDCLDKIFVIEIALHFEYWFVECIPVFLDTLMLYESQRLQTFSSASWPHDKEFIDVRKLAKCGFFYNGTSDNAQCAFCDLILHKWEPKDDPILDHNKYKPKCRFLRKNTNCMNIPDIGTISELDELLSVLKDEPEPGVEADFSRDII